MRKYKYDTMILTEAETRKLLLKEGLVYDTIMNIIRTVILGAADTGTAELGGVAGYIPLLSKNVFGLYRRNKAMQKLAPTSDAELQDPKKIKDLTKLRNYIAQNITQMVQATVFLIPGLIGDDIVALLVGQAPENVASTVAGLVKSLMGTDPKFAELVRK